MSNQEVLISLRANMKPFQDAMKSAVNDINLGIKDMQEFSAMIDNANKKQLKGIASNLQNEIKETKLIIKDMQKELVIATQTNASPKFIERLKTDIAVAKGELTQMQQKLKMVGGTPMSGIQKAMNGIKNGFKSVGQSVLKFGQQFGRMISFSAIFSMIGVLRTGLSDAVKLSDSATNNFGAMKNIIAGALVPVVEWFANAVRKAIVWVAGLIKAITGFDLIASGIKATNKNIQKLGSSAKKSGKAVKGSLSGLDEITNIETSSGGGDSSSGGDDMAVQVGALGELNSMMAEMNALDFSWAEPLKTVFNFIKENGEIIAIVLGGLALAIGVVNVAMWVLSANPIVLTIAAIILGITALVAIIVLCVKHWDEISAVATKVVDWIVEKVKWFAEQVGNFFKAIWDGIVAVLTAIGEFIWTCVETYISIWATIVGAVIGFFKSVWDGIVKIFSGIGRWFGDRINDIISFFVSLPEKIKNFFVNAYNGIKSVFGGIGNWFGDRIADIVNFFKSLPNRVWTFIKGLWDKVTGLFSNVGQAVGDAISGAVKGAINSVLKGAVNIINGFISAINLAIGVINAIPGVNIKKLSKLSVPSFDVGTNYVPQDMIAQIHKGERIVPAKYNNDDWVGEETDMTETNSLLEQLINVVASKNLSIDGSAIGRASVDYIIAENRRRGEPII